MRISDWSSDVCSSDLHCFAVHHLASTSGGDDKYTIPRSVRNRVPANARLYRHFFSAIYRCGDDRAIRLGQKGFGRETYLCTDRKSVVWGKSVSGRVDLGGRRTFKKKNQTIKKK